MALTKAELDLLEARLLQDRKRAARQLRRYNEEFATSPHASDGDLSAFSLHVADEGTDAMEREKAFLFASEEGRLLWRIDAALRRLYRAPASFGRCETCGGHVAFERLDAIPYATRCIGCQTEEETRG